MPFKIKKTVSNITLTGNSVYFTGASQYLSTPTNVAFDPGNTGAWTLECWFYLLNTANGRIVEIGNGGAWGAALGISRENTGKFAFFQSNGSNNSVWAGSSASTYAINNWYHLAVSKDSSNNIKCFINGIEDTTLRQTNVTGTVPTNNSLRVNAANDNNGGQGSNGYTSNVRWIKGTALYTASFTVPTSSLTAVTNTQLLTCNAATIIDGSTNNFTITNNGTATVSSAVTPFGSTFSPFKIKKNNPNPTMLTGYGASFNGTNNIQTPSNAAFGFGTGDWTIEGWFYSANTGRLRLWSCSDNTDNFEQNTGGDIGYYNGSTTVWTGAGAVTSSTWYHFAAVRSSGTVTIYKNGTSILTQASTPNSSARYINIGGAVNTTYNGYISNFRVLKGTALYTSSFTPPTTPLTAIASCSLLTCNAATFVDSSTNNFTLTNNSSVVASSSFTPFSSSLIVPTNYSVYFTGASQYLSTPTTTSFDPGTNTPWTLEYWGYPINGCIVTLATGVAYGNSLWVSWGSSQFTWLQGNSAGSNPVILTTAATYPANNWYHIVVCKDSANTSRMFINGIQVLSSTYNSSLGSPNRLVVNGAWDNNGFYGGGNGYVSNVRWVKGTALYTASFTAPTSPLTTVASCSLLTCQSPTIVDNSSNNLTITNNNSATVSSTITPFSASVSNGGFKLKQVSYVRPAYDFTISPAYSGKSTWDLAADGPLTFTGSGAWTIVPISNFNTTVKMWGAGGARGYSYRDSITSTNSQGPGGGGGYSTANIAIQSGVSYIVQVGQGGVRTNTASSGATYLAGGVQGSYGGAQGGGYSGIFITSTSQPNALLMAGGGGGGSDNGFSSNGGAGGGDSGQNSAGGNQGGYGGSQSAGGGAAAYNGPTGGSALTGGLGKSQSGEASLGAGGGGYWGGGGGNVGGGGGGSGRIGTNASVTSGTTTAGAADVPGNSSDADRGGAGRGGNATSNSGADGKIIITKI